MPSLMDMFQPNDPLGQPTDVGNAFTSRSNSLIGLGMGLLSPHRPWAGESPWVNALQGLQAGSAADTNLATKRAQLAHQARQEAFQRSQAARAQSNFERQFAAGQQSPFSKVAADLGLQPGSPEYIEAAKQYHQPKTDPAWDVIQVPDPSDPDNKIPMWANKRTQETRPLQPGATGMPAVPANAFPTASGAGGGTAPVYGYGGDFTAPSAVAAAPAPRGITLPNGETVTAPAGLNKEARKTWANHVATTAAKMQAGEMTEGQAKYSIYATGMEIAQQELKGLEGQGTSQTGKRLAAVPLGLGTYLQTSEYQNYRNAKDAWLNAKLRAESGATINPDEFARDERIYFPQPGESDEQVAAKARLRENITAKMTKAGGPGYVPAPAIAAPQRSDGTAPAPPPAPPSASARQTGGLPSPPPGFKIVQ